MAPVDGGRIVGARVSDFPGALIQLAEEAALVAFVANAGAERFHLNEYGVLIAIGGYGLDHEAVARGLALQPELLTGAAVKGGEARFNGFAEGLIIHVTHHEHAARGMVLNDGRDQPAGFLKIEIHRVRNKKARQGQVASRAGVLSTSVLIPDQNTARRVGV